MTFKHETGDWTRYRQLPFAIEVDFHYSGFPREIDYWDAMANVRAEALQALRDAHALGLGYVILRHGYSTSGPFKETARSQVRGLARSKDSTPYIIRRECIQHDSVFVAAIRPRAHEQRLEPRCTQCASDEVKADTTSGYFRCRSCHHFFGWFDLLPPGGGKVSGSLTLAT